MEPKSTIKVLLIDHDEDDSSIIRDLLPKVPAQRYELDRRADHGSALQALSRGSFDVCLLDDRLGREKGLSLFKAIADASRNLPVILLTGRSDYHAGLEAMEAGAADYLPKSSLNSEILERSIRYSIQTAMAKEALRKSREELEIRVRERTAELAEANQALRLNMERLHAHIENSPLAVVEFDPNYRVIYWSKQAERVFGWCAEEIVGKRIDEMCWVHEDDVQRVAKLSEAMFRGERPSNVHTNRNYRKDGSIITCEWYNSAILNQQGELVTVLSNVLDVTERKKAEEDLAHARNMLSEGQKIAHLGSFEYDVAAKQAIWSDEQYRIFGLDQERPLPTFDVIWKCIHPDDVMHVHRTFITAMESKSVYQLEHRLVHPDGSVRWVHDRAHPYFDEHGKLLRYVGTTLDVTERKQAEEALRASEQRFELAVKAAQEGVWDWNAETNEVWYSPRYKQMLGYSEDELEDHASVWIHLLHPDDRERSLQHADAVLRGERDYEIEFRMQHKDGHYLDILSRGFPVRRESDGKVVRMVGTHFDLTERKQAEEELIRRRDHLDRLVRDRTAELEWTNNRLLQEISEREHLEQVLRDSEETFHSIFDNSLDGIFFSSPEGPIFAANQAACDILGWSEQEICDGGRHLIVDTSDPRLPAALAERRRTGRFRGELNFRRKDGTVFPADGSSSIFTLQSGEMRSHVTFRDITARKVLELEREQYHTLFNTSSDLMAIFNTRTNYFLKVNPSATSILGYSAEELLGQPYANFVHPDDRQRTDEEVQEQLKRGFTLDFENRYLCKDGAVRWLSWRVTVDNDNGIAYATARDITERKQVENVLRASEERYRLLYQNANDAIFIVGMEGKVISTNKQACPALYP